MEKKTLDQMSIVPEHLYVNGGLDLVSSLSRLEHHIFKIFFTHLGLIDDKVSICTYSEISLLENIGGLFTFNMYTFVLGIFFSVKNNKFLSKLNHLKWY